MSWFDKSTERSVIWRRVHGGDSPESLQRMADGWRERVERARRILDAERREDQLRGVVFTAEETLKFLEGLR
jgi:hypothetical protein